MSAKLYTSMAEAIQELKKRGFTANFEFLDQAFRDVDSGGTFTADDLTIVEHYRFEGASDPDDMSVVYPIESDDGTQGIIADAFGVYANPQLGGFLNNVSIREDSWSVTGFQCRGSHSVIPSGNLHRNTHLHRLNRQILLKVNGRSDVTSLSLET